MNENPGPGQTTVSGGDLVMVDHKWYAVVVGYVSVAGLELVKIAYDTGMLNRDGTRRVKRMSVKRERISVPIGVTGGGDDAPDQT